MGIKEEIEKLLDEIRNSGLMEPPGEPNKIKMLHPDILSAIENRLFAILDKWELVAEGPLTNLLATRISDLIERNAYKGDTIAIYRRKKHGEVVGKREEVSPTE